MIHARARCWVHEDCLVDLELSIACGPNPPDMLALGADLWGGPIGYDGWGDGHNIGNGNGFGDGADSGDGYGDGAGAGSVDGWGDSFNGTGDGDGSIRMATVSE